MSTTEIISNYYANYDEDGRLARKWNSIEFLTTMRYIERYLTPGAKIADIGAGTGYYSRTIANRGYEVESVELSPHHIAIFKENLRPEQKINIHQGNALDLHMFGDNTFDITLVLGPMYHLFTPEDKNQAISEALRITKPGGVVFVAYCISDSTLLSDGFGRGRVDAANHYWNGKIDQETFKIKSQPEDIFEQVRKEDIDQIMKPFAVDRLHYVSTDLVARFIRDALEEMDDETFAFYLRYHYVICERADMVGLTAHSLDVFRKL